MQTNTLIVRLLAATVLSTASIAPLYAADAAPAPAAVQTDDAALTSQAKAAIAQDKDLSALNIGVTVVDGVATLSGAASSPAASKKAADLVSAVPGVKEVKNELTLAAK